MLLFNDAYYTHEYVMLDGKIPILYDFEAFKEVVKKNFS